MLVEIFVLIVKGASIIPFFERITASLYTHTISATAFRAPLAYE